MKATEYYIYDLGDSPLFIFTEKGEYASQTKEYFTGMTTKVTPQGVIFFHGDLVLPVEGCLRKVDKESFMNEFFEYLDNMEEYGLYLKSKLDSLHKQKLGKAGRRDIPQEGNRVVISKKFKNDNTKTNYKRRVLSRKNA